MNFLTNTFAIQKRNKIFSLFFLYTIFLFLSSLSIASTLEEKFSSQLDEEDKKKFQNYIAAQAEYNLILNKYWTEISEKRDIRRSKRKEGLPITQEDFIFLFPPEYKGEKLSSKLSKSWEEFQEANKPKRLPYKPLPTLETILTCSKEHYGFILTYVGEILSK